MLSEQEKREIEAEVRVHDLRRGAATEALQIVQRRRGWVSAEAVRDVAELLGLTPDEVAGLATAYDLIFRRPVGRHVILICDNVSCWIMGYNPILEHLQRRLGIGLGGTTADGRFTLLPSACIGACDLAPVMMVDYDLHTNLTADKVDEVLADYG
jgi:NADH-quinone oxidoreductase subunit E